MEVHIHRSRKGEIAYDRLQQQREYKIEEFYTSRISLMYFKYSIGQNGTQHHAWKKFINKNYSCFLYCIYFIGA